MRHLLTLFCSLVISAPLFADAPAPVAAPAPSVTPAPSIAPKDVPTKESINKLLVAMNVETYVAESQNKLDASMKSGLDRSLQGKNLSPEMRNKIDTLQKNNSTILADAFAWPLMQAMYDQVYSETFTQHEIDDLTVFYNSPTGKAFLTKMPLATRRTMVIM